MEYTAEYLGTILQTAFEQFDPDDNADALAQYLNARKAEGMTLLTSVTDTNIGQDILIFTVKDSTPGEVWP